MKIYLLGVFFAFLSIIWAQIISFKRSKKYGRDFIIDWEELFYCLFIIAFSWLGGFLVIVFFFPQIWEFFQFKFPKYVIKIKYKE